MNLTKLQFEKDDWNTEEKERFIRISNDFFSKEDNVLSIKNVGSVPFLLYSVLCMWQGLEAKYTLTLNYIMNYKLSRLKTLEQVRESMICLQKIGLIKSSVTEKTRRHDIIDVKVWQPDADGKKHGGYERINCKIIEDFILTAEQNSIQWVVYCFLCKYYNEKYTYAYPSYREMEAVLGISKSTLQNNIYKRKKLSDKLVTVTISTREGTANRYSVLAKYMDTDPYVLASDRSKIEKLHRDSQQYKEMYQENQKKTQQEILKEKEIERAEYEVNIAYEKHLESRVNLKWKKSSNVNNSIFSKTNKVDTYVSPLDKLFK